MVQGEDVAKLLNSYVVQAVEKDTGNWELKLRPDHKMTKHQLPVNECC